MEIRDLNAFTPNRNGQNSREKSLFHFVQKTYCAVALNAIAALWDFIHSIKS